MITKNHPIHHVARITLECQSPLSISSDEADPTIDNSIFRDALGNPTIPGTSIAGVLNHLVQDTDGIPNTLFGHTENEGHASAIRCSFGFVHNANNQVIKGSMQAQTDDNITRFLAQQSPVLRDHVCLNEYGAANDQGKFDRSAVPKGTRFTFEISLSSTKAEQQENNEHWQNLLKLINSNHFRIGGLTHRGFGQVEVIGIKQQSFDFNQPNQITDWATWQKSDWKTSTPTENKTKPDVLLDLIAEDFWRVGEGTQTLQNNPEKEPDAKPYTETIIKWQNNQASLQHKQVVMPATGIKGALRHRTLFHLRNLKQDWQGEQIKDNDLSQLFGQKGEMVAGKQQGQASAMYINDIYHIVKDPSKQTKVMMHNKIDRFTGGTINGALFSEELIYKGTLPCEISFNKTRLKQVDNDIKKAFIEAVTDLGQGRLSLGAGSSKGHGYFEIKDLNTTINTLKQVMEVA